MKLKLKEYLLPLPPGIRTFMILKSKLFFIACFLDESAPPHPLLKNEATCLFLLSSGKNPGIAFHILKLQLVLISYSMVSFTSLTIKMTAVLTQGTYQWWCQVSYLILNVHFPVLKW